MGVYLENTTLDDLRIKMHSDDFEYLIDFCCATEVPDRTKKSYWIEVHPGTGGAYYICNNCSGVSYFKGKVCSICGRKMINA